MQATSKQLLHIFACNKHFIHLKTTRMKKFWFLLMAALVITACNKDDEEETPDPTPNPPTLEEQLVGTYTFTSATFNNQVTMTNNGVPITFEAGADAYQFVGEGLLGSAPCDNADNAAMELKADFTAYYACLNENNESQMGTWSVNEDDAILTLNMTDPLPFSIPITQIVLTETKLTGVIEQLPVPIEITEPVGILNMQMANVSIEFTIVN